MRNAAATAQFDDDFALREPPRRKAARRAGSKAKKTPSRWSAFKVNPRLLLKRAAIGAGVIVALGIVVNALELQKGRHPAPLFGTSVIIAPDGTPASGAAHVAPAPTPVLVPLPKPIVRNATAATAAPDAIADAAAVPEVRLKPKLPPAIQHDPQPSTDEITRLLERGPAAHHTPTAHSAAVRPQSAARPAHAAPAARIDARTVYGVQQALVKLGFVLKPNGVFGPQTKKALGLFGKERKLPIAGELSPRIVKILAAESGLRIANP